MGIALTIELGLNPRTAFEVFVEELVQSLELRGFTFDPRENGLVLDKKTEDLVGEVRSWQPPDFIELEWFSKSWTPEKMTTTKIAFAPASRGTIVQITNSGWNSSIFEGDEKELTGWAASVLVAPFLVSTHHRPSETGLLIAGPADLPGQDRAPFMAIRYFTALISKPY